MGFVLVSMAIFVLQILIIIYKAIYLTDENSTVTTTTTDSDGTTSTTTTNNYDAVLTLFECIAGFGLGGSTVALFGRVGGGIYTKAADVGSDLAGKVINGLEEDDASNPGVIADNVGDNVGDIAGMGSDLFGSLAESTCAALVIGATSDTLIDTTDAMYFPLCVTAVGILVSFVTSLFATNFTTVNYYNVESTVKWQLIISTVLMSGALVPITYLLPETFDVGTGDDVTACS